MLCCVLCQRINNNGAASSSHGLHSTSVGRLMNAGDSRMTNVDQPEGHSFPGYCDTNGFDPAVGSDRSQRHYDDSEQNVIASRRQLNRPVSGRVVFADQVGFDLFCSSSIVYLYRTMLLPLACSTL